MLADTVSAVEEYYAQFVQATKDASVQGPPSFASCLTMSMRATISQGEGKEYGASPERSAVRQNFEKIILTAHDSVRDLVLICFPKVRDRHACEQNFTMLTTKGACSGVRIARI
jgi:hypothetical protein